MTRTQPEARIVAAILKRLNSAPNTYARKTHGSRYSVGWPDIVGCSGGLMFAIEAKVPGKHATPRQAHELAQWRLAGAHVGTAHSVEEAEDIVWPHSTTPRHGGGRVAGSASYRPQSIIRARDTESKSRHPMTDWLTPDELGRIEGVLEQTIPNEATRIIVSMMAHAAEADRRIAALEAERDEANRIRVEDTQAAQDRAEAFVEERHQAARAAIDDRDDVIRELADALRELTDHLELGTSPLPETVRLNRAALARVDALNEPMTGRRCGDDDCDGGCCARVDALTGGER